MWVALDHLLKPPLAYCSLQQPRPKCALTAYTARERFATLGADKGSWDEVRVMVALEMHVKQLLLTEGFIAMATGVRLFSSVGSLMHDHVPFLEETKKRPWLTLASMIRLGHTALFSSFEQASVISYIPHLAKLRITLRSVHIASPVDTRNRTGRT